jgi:hypothetical protein
MTEPPFVMPSDPPVREDGRCAECGKRRPEVAKRERRPVL